MHFDHLTPLLPCRALDELAAHRKADEAEQLLAAWSALWHPALVAAARAMPRWSPAESPPSEPAGHLLLLPPCCEALLPADWLEGAEPAGACVLRQFYHRPEMVAAALSRIEAGASEMETETALEGTGCRTDLTAIDPELEADFLALGFCHFTIELLTQHLRYMSNLDEASFERELIAAADHAVRGEVESARGRLQAAFDLLHTAREYFYPVEAHLLDLTLLASTTLGQSLRAEVTGTLPVNFLASGQVIEEMAQREPASLAALRAALEDNRAALLGGEYCELELPLLVPEAIRRQLEKGLDAYQRHLGTRPTVYGRRRFGLTPVLPQILEKLGFVGAMHSTLDDGRFPANNQSRVRWEGIDGTVMEALARVPSDIGRADAFLRLPQQLGNSMDMDHVATVLFAHWPGRSSPWYEDVRRITRYTTVMGKLATVSDYFQRTGMSGQQAAYKADEYRSPYLKQAVAAGQVDPISRWMRYYRLRAAAGAAQTLHAIAAMVTGGAAALGDALLGEVDDSLAADHAAEDSLDQRIEEDLQEAATRFSRAIGGTARPAGQGFLVANPLSFPRRICLEIPQATAVPQVAEPVRWAAESAGRKTVVVDVPPMGFAWIAPGSGAAPPPKPEQRKWGIFRSRPLQEPPLAQWLEETPERARPARSEPNQGGARGTPSLQGAVLRNEFFEVIIDPKSGSLRGVYDFRSRGPRLGQQIAMRLPDASGEADDAYSTMLAEEIAVTSPGPALGETIVRGRLIDRSARRLAGFQQTTRVWRGSRVIELEIELDVDQRPGVDPWDSYYSARFAWPDEAANLYRSVNMANLATEAVQLEAPHFIDVRLDKLRTTLLTGGLPYHRRSGLRRLDTLLAVRGETARRFRLGIGIDLPHPMAAALDFLAPPTLLAGAGQPPTAFGWLFHLDARNVVATHWEPLMPIASARGASIVSASGAGFRVRLLETDGRPVSLGLRSFRAVQSAQKSASADRPPVDLPIEGDRITVDLGGHEWAEVEARFAP